MGLKIYDRNGGLRIEVQPSDSSSQTAELQGDDVLSMSFTHHGYAGLEVDDYVDFEGVRYRMTERYRPKQKSAMEWEYSVKLYGPESLLHDVLVIKNFEGEQEAEFTLTAPPAEHVALVVSALNGGSGGEWKRGTVTGTENITIDYFGKYCDEALREIAEKAGTEYWTDGTTVNVCRCEHGEPLTLGLADGLTRIEPATAGNVKFYTRLFPMGSTRNIDAESYGHRRLQLPDGAKYVEINADRYRRKDHYEEAAFADIYPRYTGTVSSVRSEVLKGTDGEDFTVYYIKDDALPFDPDDYLMAGKVMRISFQEGSDLGGLGDEDNGTYYFEANWHADTGEFELITIWPYKDSTTQLPGGVLVPKAGDKYIPWNIRMPQEYYTLAEAEFAAAVQKYNADHDVDLTVFKAQTDHVWVEDNAADLFVGRRVRLVSDRYFPETGYRDSRITKISRKINLPTQMEVEIGDALGRSSKTKITDDIRDARDYARSIGNSVSLPDIIRTGDTTRPTDNNLMSALRIIKDFLCKYKDDRTAHKLATDKAFEVGEFLAGISGGFFGIDQNGDSYLEVARLYARVRAVFEELTVIKTGVLAGKQYITPGGGIVCTRVEEVKNASGTLTGWRCYFLSEQDGEKTECKFIVNDQAISALFNAKTGTANKVSNHRYWRLVTAVDNDAFTDDCGNHYGYIELSATDCESGSDTPQAGDEICQFGYRGTDEPRRQTAMVFSTVDADAPSIKLFRGINSYTLEGKAVVQFGVDAQSGKVFFRLGASDATHYLDYTEAGGLQVAGKISTLSTLDDTGTTLGAAINSKVEDTDVLWRLHTSQTDAPALPVLGADGTITDMKGWQTDAPAVEAGKFVWTTTYVRYGNGTAKYDGTACVTGRDGKDAVTQTSEVVEYAAGTSGTSAPVSGWQPFIPAVPQGQYQWTRVTTTYSDGTSTVSYSVAYIPRDGEDGAAGANGAGYSVNLVIDSDTAIATAGYLIKDFHTTEDLVEGEKYTLSIWGELAAGKVFNVYDNKGSMLVCQPKLKADGLYTTQFTWKKSANATNASFQVYNFPSSVSGTSTINKIKLEQGYNDNPVWTPAPLAIVSTSITYAKNTTGIQPSDASFTATSIGELGTISGGDYIWSKTAVTYTDGTVLKSYAVSRIGSDGETQIAGLHLAYATGITGSLPRPTAVTGFSTAMVAGVVYKYIGIRKDNQVADSTDFADYDWAEFRGPDGRDGASYTGNMLAGTAEWKGWFTDGLFSKDGTYEGLDVMHGVSQSSGFYSLGITSAVTLEADTVYTLSMWAKGTGRFFSYVWPSVTARIINIDGVDSTSVAGDTKAEHTLSTAWKRYFVVFRTLSGSTLTDKNVIAARLHAGDGEVWIAGAKIEKGDNRTPAWSPHPSEMVSTPARLVTLNADGLVFTYADDFSTLMGASSISITATVQGIANPTYQWSCKLPGQSGFTNISGATSAAYSLAHNDPIWGSGTTDKAITLRCTVDGVHDEVTIAKVSSGSNGSNYSENLMVNTEFKSKGTWAFGTNVAIDSTHKHEERNSVKSAQSGLTVNSFRGISTYYKENVKEGDVFTASIWVYVEDLSTIDSGVNLEIWGYKDFSRVGNCAAISIKPTKANEWQQFHVSHVMPATVNRACLYAYVTKNGTVWFASPKLERGINPNPVWTPAASEMVGQDAYTVILGNESHIFEGDTQQAKAGSAECGVMAYRGATQVAATIGTISGMPTGMTASVQGNGSTSARFTVAVTTALTTRQGTLTIPVTVEGKTFNKIFSWSLSLEGQPGADYSENLLADAGFGGLASADKEARWRVNSVSSVRADNTHALNGRNSIKVARTGLTTDTYTGLSQNYTVDVKPGDVFTASIWTYCEDLSAVDAGAKLELGLYNSGGSRVSANGREVLPTKTNEWQCFSYTATIPAGVAFLQVYPFVRRNGTMWFSSPKLERGSNPSPVWTPNPGDRIPVLSEEYYLSTSDTELSGGSWSATKQKWEDGRFYWTRIKKLYGDGTIEYTTPICVTARNGQDALRLDLTNEMAAVACDASGEPVSGALPVKSKAVVYRGGGIDSGWAFAIPANGASGCSASMSGGEISVTGITADTATVTVEATKAGHDGLTATMSIHKVRPGANGQPAVVYQIEPDTSVVKRDMAGTPHPTELPVTKYITTGADARQVTNAGFLYASQTDAAGKCVMPPVCVADTTQSTATIPIAPDAAEVVLELRPVKSTASGVPVLDRETVPVITDVAGMEVATRNLLLTSGDWNLSDGALSGDPLKGDWWWDDLGMTGSNGNLKMTCNATAGNRCAYEKLSIRKAAQGTTMTLRVKGSVSGLTSGHVYFQLISDWKSWQTVGQVDANGEFDHTMTFDLRDTWNGDTVLAYGFGNANSGISLELEHAGLYIGNVIPTQWTAAPEDGSYLLKAIQRATQDSTEIDGGVILAALLRLGITGSDGVRKIMAGLNGNGKSRDALAAFFGGDFIDAAREPTNDNRARAGIYHNGNGYFCDNIVRFLDRLIEIGPDGQKHIQFDEHGMHAFAADGTTIMTITSNPLNYEVVEAVRGDMKNIGTPSTALYSLASIIHPVTMPNGMIRQGSCTIQGRGSAIVSLANLAVGDQINVPVTLNLGYTITQDLSSYAYSGYFKVRIYKGSGSTLVEAFSQTATINPSTGKGSMQVTATITEAGTYTLEVTFGNAMLATTGGTAATVSGINTGTITSGVANQIHIGANGMLVVRQGMKFLLNDNYFGVMVGSGFGLQIQSNVMTMKLASSQWLPLSKASDGTLHLG